MKTILVTGASGGLGTAVVEHLHQQGYPVLAVISERADPTLFNHLPGVKTQPLDVLNAEKVTAFLSDNLTTDIQAAILLVGGFTVGTLAETDVDLFHRMIALNFLSAFHVVRPLLAQFAERGGGQFVLIGSRPALNPDEGKNVAAYALSKTLIFSLADLINADGKNHNITATVVVPGTFDTLANRKAMPDADPTHWVPTENMAELIGFLLSDTGQMTHETVIKLYNRS